MGFLRKNPEGTHLGQISDAYPSVSADIAHLQKEVIPTADIMQLACFMQGGRQKVHILCAVTICLLQHADNEWAVSDCHHLMGKTIQCKATCMA